MRVVSVLPSATEIVCALGHAGELVGRSAECDYPPEVSALPVVMRPRTWDADQPSGRIDARVRAARGRGESLYELDVELLRALRPDLLLTQDLCGVCSVTEAEVAAACTEAGVAPRVVSLAPRRLAEVWSSVGAVAQALGDPGAAESVLGRCRRASTPESTCRPRPNVAVVEWLDPPILSGLWTPDMVAIAGGSPVGPEPGETGIRTTWEQLASLPIDLVLLSPCSFTVDRSLQELKDGRIRRSVDTLSPGLGTFVVDEAYFSRPGPRLADGVELLRGLLHGNVSSPPMPVRTVLPALPRAAV